MTFDEWYEARFDGSPYHCAKAAWQAATLAEREACAKVCELERDLGIDDELSFAGVMMAIAIRARSNHE